MLDGLPKAGALTLALRRHAPSLAMLLARGRTLPGQNCLSAAIAYAFGLEAGAPIAAYTLAMDGMNPEQALWLRADPISLHFYQDQLVALGPDRLGVDQTEANALIAMLQSHFEAEGLSFYAPTPSRWYLRLSASEPAPEADPLDVIDGRAVAQHLPRGPAAALWRRRLNEIQMLLHAHPVNQRREAVGKWPINSVWFWGAGRYRPVVPPDYGLLAARHPLALALAKAAGLSCIEPQRLNVLDEAESAMVILHLPAGEAEDSLAAALAQWEHNWFRPILSALRRRSLGQVRLECTGALSASCDLTPWSVYRFWRRQPSWA